MVLTKFKGKIKYTSKAKNELSAYGVLGDLASSVDPVYEIPSLISYKLDKSSNLSNDDKVKIKWELDDELKDYFNCNIKSNSDKEYTVSGLEEIKKVDIFKDIKVTFSGLSGEGEIDVDYGDDNLGSYLSIDNTYNLSNGDKVTISIPDSVVESYAKKYGQLPKENSKTYTVEGLGEYVTKLSEISADFKKEAQAAADDIMKAQAAKYKDYDDDVTSANYEYAGDYLQVKKSSSDSWYATNYYGLVYKMSVTSGGETSSIYQVVQFKNVLVNDAKECSADFNNYDSPTSDSVSINDTWYSIYGYKSFDSLENDLDKDAADYTYETNF